MRLKKAKIPFLVIAILVVSSFVIKTMLTDNATEYSQSVKDVPAFSGTPYVVINNNEPEFSEKDITNQSFEFYSELDALGRCRYAMASIGYDLMPTEDRGSIGQVKPSGWHTVKYEFVDGKYLYNRCHLIGYQLTGENANEENLITGTRYLNVEGMLPFENMVAEYVEQTGNHVLYRVTPVFEGSELVARGVQMEARSVEDNGEGVCFNVFVYNVQPGVSIDYATGESCLEEKTKEDGVPPADQPKPVPPQQMPEEPASEPAEKTEYVINLKSEKFHFPSCTGVSTMSEKNKQPYTGTKQELLDMGYSPCGQCKP